MRTLLTVDRIQAIIRERIPAGLVVAEHTEEGHFYRHTVADRLFASVTTKAGILDAPHLKKWSAGLAIDYVIMQATSAPLSAEKLRDIKPGAILHHQELFHQAGDIGTRCHAVIEDYLGQWIQTGEQPLDIREFVKRSESFNDSRVWAASRSAEMFCNDFNVIPIACEMKVASLKHAYAGTLDTLMMVGLEVNAGNGLCDDQASFDGTKKRHNWMDSAGNPLRKVCSHCWKKIEYHFAIVDWKTSNSIGTEANEKFEYAMQQAAYDKALTEMTGLKVKKIFVVRLDKEQAKYEVRMLMDRPGCFKAFTHISRVYDWMHNGKSKLVSALPKANVSAANLTGLKPVN